MLELDIAVEEHPPRPQIRGSRHVRPGRNPEGEHQRQMEGERAEGEEIPGPHGSGLRAYRKVRRHLTAPTVDLAVNRSSKRLSLIPAGTFASGLEAINEPQ
jgi:hypothetical protein